MSKSTSINVDILTQYKGANSLKTAQSDFQKLGAATKKLGVALGVTFAAKEIIAFGKASIQAFATNQKQVALLTNTLHNLGQGFQTANVNKFIDSLSLASGKTKEELIPAFQNLFIATKDAGTAQSELKLAMDVSAGTGKDLNTVTTALAKGFLGNTTALTRLGAGLSKTTLASKDMTLINAELARTFQGDATAAANTFQGTIDRLNVTMTDAKVIIGTDLVQAFQELSGNSGIGNASNGFLTFVGYVGDAIIGVERLLTLTGLFLTNKSNKEFIASYKAADAAQKAIINNQKQIYGGHAADVYLAQKMRDEEAAARASAAAALKTANALTQAAKDKLKAERDSLNLRLAGSTTDMQNIEIQAALQKGQTQQVTDVLLLQRAILNQNADQAEILAQNVLKANGLVMDVSGNISAIGKASNPFADWPTLAQTALDQIKLMLAGLVINPTLAVTNPSASLGTNGINSSVSSATLNQIANNGDVGLAGAMNASQGNNVNITVTTSPDLVVTATQTASSNGSSVTLSRLNPFGQYGLGF